MNQVEELFCCLLFAVVMTALAIFIGASRGHGHRS